VSQESVYFGHVLIKTYSDRLEYEEYGADGTLLQRYATVDGENHGKYETFWENGLPKEIGQFDHGEKTGIYSWFDTDGTLLKTHEY
jgi:antitoxin component YwqK of YwqJK toxin-antitoxin module